MITFRYEWFRSDWNSAKRRELIDYIHKTYGKSKKEEICEYATTPLRGFFNSIPWLGALLAPRVDEITVHACRKPKSFCRNCRYPNDKDDLIRDSSRGIPSCRCCLFKTNRVEVYKWKKRRRIATLNKIKNFTKRIERLVKYCKILASRKSNFLFI